MKKKSLNMLKCYSKLLKNKEIKKIFESYYPEYELKETNQDSIVLIKQNNINYEVVEINFGPHLNHIKCERRPNGVIITKTEYIFNPTAYSNGKSILVRLLEKRFVLTNDKIRLITKSNEFDLKTIYEMTKRLSLGIVADMKNIFVINKNYITKDRSGNLVKSYFTPTRVFLNEQDISYMYDSIAGNDNIYRIYDLYCGILSNKNEQDIININTGFLTTDVFDLKTLKKITESEDKLVGKSLEIPNENYINYIKNFFYNNFGYNGLVKNDREILLKCITYKNDTVDLSENIDYKSVIGHCKSKNKQKNN